MMNCVESIINITYPYLLARSASKWVHGTPTRLRVVLVFWFTTVVHLRASLRSYVASEYSSCGGNVIGSADNRTAIRKN